MQPAIPIAQVGEGDMAACDVDGVKLLVCQVEGRFYALHNQCSHARQALHTRRAGPSPDQMPAARRPLRCAHRRLRRTARGITHQDIPLMLENGKVYVDVAGMEERPRPRFGPLV